MKQQRLRTILLLALLGFLTTQSASAQFGLDRYLSQDEVDRATQAAKDSLGDDALLVGIAAPGEVDLSEIGLGYERGFNANDGTSSVWGYLYLNPDRSDSIGIAVVRLSGFPLIFAERGGDFDQEPVDLDLTGMYSGSDAFVQRLNTDVTFQKYQTDYPDAVPNAAVLAWRPEGAAEILPSTFPVDKPLWSIFYGDDELNDSAMVCFVASGDGDVFCFRFGEPDTTTSVTENRIANDQLSISLHPNPVSKQNEVRINIQTAKGEKPDHVALYDATGREVANLLPSLEVTGNGTFSVQVDLNGLSSGEYFCRAVIGTSVRSVPMIVE